VAVPYLHKRTATPGAAPTTAQIALGQLVINTFDGKLYLKKNVSGTETVVEVGGGAGGTGVLTAKCASTANQALSGGTAFPTIDAVVTAAGDLVLLKDQTTASQNGLYLVGGTGAAWTFTRVTTMDAASEAAAQTVAVQQGTANGGERFVTTFLSTNTLGTTSMVWEKQVRTAARGAMIEMEQTISESYTIATGKNAVSAGPITIATGATVTVPTGSTWTIV
jgi:hypothetical protein